ncbi:MAG: hypothetical protein ACMXYF_05255 [Candidatus Woesearchaeota archaeon]
MSRIGQTESTYIIWLVIAIAAGILFSWILPQLSNTGQSFSAAASDVDLMVSHVNVACRSSAFSSQVVLNTRQGYFQAENRTLCIEIPAINHCQRVVCNVNLTNISLSESPRLNIYKSGGDEEVYIERAS